ncbi:glycosyltransferase [Peribacillus saganii]|uniref:Glycosyltransferase n=1 Tax=Peribacillus saganii TaxID=2303992 RepID=A0A372LP67_9BACI|nr:glycosyltransferase [Peribacillus saganii]RFU69551.1 glycosyltransferase [Peribacillus saganii]
MKILHVISGGETGGSRKHVNTLLEKFPQEQVCLLVFQEGALSQEARDAGIRVELLKQSSRYDLSVLKRLTNFINTEKFDIVHSHGPRANLFLSFIKAKISAVWVTTIHSDPTLDFMKRGIKGYVFTKLNLSTLNKIDFFFAVSERFKENLMKFGIPSEKIQTIYNGIDFSEPLEPNQKIRQELGLKHSDFVMAMVARLHPIKGHDIVLQALKQMDKPDVHLLLVGDGPIRSEIEQMVSNLGLNKQVHFLGFRKDVNEIYSNSDVALLASQSESFPLALLEAANQKLPVITTDVGGVRQLVSDPHYGWVVEVNNENQYLNAMREAYDLNEKCELASQGELLYKHAVQHFSLENLYKLIEETYRKLIR